MWPMTFSKRLMSTMMAGCRLTSFWLTPGGSLESVKEVTLESRRVTRLGEYEPQVAFEAFALRADNDGLLDEEAFLAAFRAILTDEHIYAMDDSERERIGEVTQKIFDVFDVDNSGQVDFAELASGLSVLCGGSAILRLKRRFLSMITTALASSSAMKWRDTCSPCTRSCLR